ncbi:hypothetical protein [Streptomyces aureus]|uniref:Uncharacterized protein n=1 Tax=Streptomyces aureus TaxID=193461 RepID=A0ABV4SVB9_9ACTN
MTHAPTAYTRDRREPGEVFGPSFSLFADVLLVGLLTTAAASRSSRHPPRSPPPLPPSVSPPTMASRSGPVRTSGTCART